MLDRLERLDRFDGALDVARTIQDRNDRLLASIRRARSHRPDRDELAHAFATQSITREDGCDRKVPYRTREYAEKVAARVAKGLGHRQTPYFCNYCHRYHLTTDKA